MNDNSSGQNRFEGWRDAVADAVAFAEQFPQEVRSGVVLALLTGSESRGRAQSPKGSVLKAGGGRSPQEPSGIAAVAQDACVDENTLGRFIQIGDDDTVTVRARLGTSRADSQNIYSTLVAYVREKALGELDTESASIHAICNEHRCVDRNFAANLRKREWLLEHDVKGNKSYRLSPEGEQAAREQIVSLCGGN